MTKRVTRDFGDLPVFVRQALLKGIEGVDDPECTEVLVTGVHRQTQSYDPVNDIPPIDGPIDPFLGY